jgi:hypothetical protein
MRNKAASVGGLFRYFHGLFPKGMAHFPTASAKDFGRFTRGRLTRRDPGLLQKKRPQRGGHWGRSGFRNICPTLNRNRPKNDTPI